MIRAKMSTLAALANGIIPADVIDSGAASVDAAKKIAERVEAGVNAGVYETGLAAAEDLAMRVFSAPVWSLSPEQVDQLIGQLKSETPGFFKQLRMDVCALYLSEPAVWERMGFPGPSSESGGYPDFDRPQGDLRKS